MKNVLERATAAVVVGLLTYSVSLNVTAEETTSITAAPDSRILDREGKPIYGAELMTESEISGLKSMLFSIKDPKDREDARAAHRKAMDKRAAERGVKVQE
jgi:hypothetical protein